jgi:hypothetical protein
MVPQHSATGALRYSGVDMRNCRVGRGTGCDPLSASWLYSSNGIFELMLVCKVMSRVHRQDSQVQNGKQCHPVCQKFASARYPARGFGGRLGAIQSSNVLLWASQCAVRLSSKLLPGSS